jgi:hypothetical protein
MQAEADEKHREILACPDEPAQALAQRRRLSV